MTDEERLAEIENSIISPKGTATLAEFAEELYGIGHKDKGYASLDDTRWLIAQVHELRERADTWESAACQFGNETKILREQLGAATQRAESAEAKVVPLLADPTFADLLNEFTSARAEAALLREALERAAKYIYEVAEYNRIKAALGASPSTWRKDDM